MRVVVDANVVAAAMVRPMGWTARELWQSKVRFYGPDLLWTELSEHAEDYAVRAGCALGEWQRRVEHVMRQVHSVPLQRLVRHANDPLVQKVERVDPDDAPYVACFLEVGADFLWTRDRALVQCLGRFAGPVLPGLRE